MPRQIRQENYLDLKTKSRGFLLTVVIIFFASLTLNLIQSFFLVSPWNHIYSDMHGYIERGWRISVGDNIYPFDSFYPPGTAFLYGAVFAVFGFVKGVKVLAIVQSVFLASANVLTALTAKELFSSRFALIIAGALTMLYWPLAAQSSFFMAEPLFVFLAMLGQYLLVRGVRSKLPQRLYLSGFVFGLATITKTQGLCFLIPAVVILFRAGNRTKELPFLLAGFCLPIICQVALISAIMGGPQFTLAANGAFNAYLGQSRRVAVGCLDLKAEQFFIFSNNNAHFDSHLLPTQVVDRSILDRDFFSSEVRKLWAADPKLQLIRSLQSVNELFSFQPDWPYRNILSFRKPYRWFLIMGGLIIIVPAIYSLVLLYLQGGHGKKLVLLALPILGIALTAALGSGQPRYLLPFQYNLIILATPAWNVVFGVLGRKNL